MRTAQLEAWVLRVLDSLKGTRQAEDSRVELKAEWPSDPWRTARRLAGSANAARGEDVLWIIGADEETKEVVGAAANELASWWPAVRKFFDDGMAPEPQDLVVPYDGTSVVALLFRTDRSPYVVCNPDFGTAGVVIAREVPWRAQTGVRSAKREDLVRMLVPVAASPTIEVRSAWATAIVGGERYGWDTEVRIYVVHTGSSPVVVPFHHCEGTLTASLGPARGDLTIQLEGGMTGSCGSWGP